MKIKFFIIFTAMFLALRILSYAQALTSDDLVGKIKSIVDIDFEQEDQLKPLIGNYADSINKINDLIQKGVDQDVIDKKLLKLNHDLDLQLKNILTDDQMHQWNVEKRVFYKEILTTANTQNQSP